MSRKDPGKPPVVSKGERAGWVTETRKYKVITPLFGGGEETQKADSVTTVRATEVRGHLRFWWRATRGGMFGGDLKKLREAEENIWGSPGEKNRPGPSKVVVWIVHSEKGKSIKEIEGNKGMVEIGEPQSPWGYVAFPLRAREDKQTHKRIPAGSVLDLDANKPKYHFELELKYHKDVMEEVEAALWAWETFGGIGARTRRGFGALQNMNFVAASKQEMRNVINTGLKKYVEEGAWPDGVPHLKRQLDFVVKPSDDPLAAWEYLFQHLKTFRQDRYPGSTSRFGRSKWPEPDSIRRILNEEGKYTYGLHKPAHPVQKKFPRAKFGLPIRFEFPVLKDKPDPKDPQTTTLQGIPLDNQKSIDRLASPLILRPIACSDGAVGLATILEWEPIDSDERYTPPGGLRLTSEAYGEFPVKSNLELADAGNIEPLKSVNNGKPEPDVLKAFLDSLK